MKLSKKDLYFKGIAEIGNKKLNLMSDDGWNHFMGAIWKDIFSKYGMKKDATVIEVAPGSINKIGWGLSEYKFNGEVYIVEPDMHSLKSITKQYKEILKGKVKPVGLPLDKVIPALPKKVNAILANHPLDDMIGGKLLTKRGYDRFFDITYKNADFKRKVWKKLDSEKKKVERVKKEVIYEWCKLIDSTNPELVVIAQYRSWFFRLNNIHAPDKHAYDVLEAIKKKYKQYAVDIKSKHYIEEPERWLILKRK